MSSTRSRARSQSPGEEERKDPASLQKKIDTHIVNPVAKALNAVIDAAAFSSVDETEVGDNLVQGRQSSDDVIEQWTSLS